MSILKFNRFGAVSRKSRRLFLASAPLALVALTIPGCNETKSRFVLVSLKTLDNPFFQSIREGIDDASTAELGLIVRAGQNESDLNSQRSTLESFYTEQIAGKAERDRALVGLIITPTASGAELVPQIARYRSSGVPVVVVDTAIDRESLLNVSSDYNLFLGSDNFRGGQLAAEHLLANLPPSSSQSLLLLNGQIGSETAQSRRRGFLDVVESRGYRLTERSAEWRKNDAREIVASLLASGQEFAGIFAANDNMALGAVTAYQAAGKQIPPVVGFDAIPEAVEAVNAGSMLATVAQDPVEMGRQAMLAFNDLNTLKTSSFQDNLVLVKLITKS